LACCRAGGVRQCAQALLEKVEWAVAMLFKYLLRTDPCDDCDAVVVRKDIRHLSARKPHLRGLTTDQVDVAHRRKNTEAMIG